jgi:hypothetical protein
MSPEDRISLRLGEDVLRALDEACRRAHLTRSDFLRELLRAALGMRHEQTGQRLTGLLVQHPRLHQLGLVEAALEYFLKDAEAFGLDVDLVPRRPPPTEGSGPNSGKQEDDALKKENPYDLGTSRKGEMEVGPDPLHLVKSASFALLAGLPHLF